MVNKGYINLFRSFSIKGNKEFKMACKIISQDNCSILKEEDVNKEGKNKYRIVDLKDEVKTYIDFINENKKNSEVASDNIGKSYMKSYICKEQLQFEEIVVNHINYYTKFVGVTSKHIGKTLENVFEPFLLQPILFSKDNQVYNIYITLNLYNMGVGVVDFSIPINNVKFEKLYNPHLGGLTLENVQIPKYILDKSSNKIEYINFGSKRISEIVDMYTSYIMGLISDKNGNTEEFSNYSLLDYKDSNSVSKDVKRNIYWIIHQPFLYLNEQLTSVYDNFWNESYCISKFARLLVGTHGRSVAILGSECINEIRKVYEKEINKDELYYEMFNSFKYSIETVMVKQFIYKEMIRRLKENSVYMNKKVLNKLKVDMYINNINEYGFSSVNSLTKFIEESCCDFFPKDKYDNQINDLEKIVISKESIQREKINIFCVTVTSVLTIIFSYDAINKMLTMLDMRYGWDIAKNSYYIWIGILIIIVFYWLNIIIRKFDRNNK